jgi:hypothetical protein
MSAVARASSSRFDEVIARADAEVLRDRRSRRAGARAASSVACGACAGRIELADFALIAIADAGGRMARTADCPACGETTVIALLRPV